MKILKFLFYSNFWISSIGGIYAAFLAWGNYNKFPDLLLIFIPLSIFIAYNFLRLWQVKDYSLDTASERHVYYIKYQEFIKWFSYCFSIIWILCLTFFPFKIVLSLVPLAIISLLYHPPLIINIFKLNLREIPHLKSILVGICWGYLLYLFPSLLIDNFKWYFLYNFFFLSLYFWAITIPFDIRDLAQDEIKNVPTLAVKLGTTKVKQISIISLILCSILSLIGAYLDFLKPILAYSLAISFILSIFIVYKAETDKPTWRFDAFIDGSMLLAPAIYLLLKFAFS